MGQAEDRIRARETPFGSIWQNDSAKNGFPGRPNSICRPRDVGRKLAKGRDHGEVSSVEEVIFEAVQ